MKLYSGYFSKYRVDYFLLSSELLVRTARVKQVDIFVERVLAGLGRSCYPPSLSQRLLTAAFTDPPYNVTECKNCPKAQTMP